MRSRKPITIYDLRFLLLLAVYCILTPPFVFGQTVGIRYAFTIEKFYKDRIDTPAGIFVDKEQQEVYVADSGRGEVLVFDLKGNPLFKFGKEQGIFNPYDLAVRNGRIYLAQAGKPYIEVFNYRGESIAQVVLPEGMAFSPGTMATDENGSLYVINKNETNCVVFDSRDKFVGKIGAGLASLSGVAVSKDRVYLITPFDNHAVQVYDKKGNFIMAFEGKEGEGGTLGLPVAARIDKNGLLWLVDSLKGIIVYDKDGGQIARFGDYGTERWQVNFPMAIDFYEDNMVYVANQGSRWIGVFKIER